MSGGVDLSRPVGDRYPSALNLRLNEIISAFHTISTVSSEGERSYQTTIAGLKKDRPAIRMSRNWRGLLKSLEFKENQPFGSLLPH